jgi:biopolymer transport protein ExbB
VASLIVQTGENVNLTERINHGFDALGAEWIMWLLLILSALSLACIVERWLFLRKRKVDLESAWSDMEKRFDDGSVAPAEPGLSMEERVALSLLAQRERPAEALEDIARASVETEKLEYNRRLGFLATVGSNAPFIGLLGTVVGIVEAFARLADAAPGANRSQLIMGSLAEALAATAVGLVVAIPAVAAYNWFQQQVDDCEARSQILVRRIIAKLR